MRQLSFYMKRIPFCVTLTLLSFGYNMGKISPLLGGGGGSGQENTCFKSYFLSCNIGPTAIQKKVIYFVFREDYSI